MILFITPQNKEAYQDVLKKTYEIRKKVFVDKLKWDLKCQGAYEIDQFDHERAHYLIYVDVHEEVKGCMRLMPTTETNLTQDIFGEYVPKHLRTKNCKVWEASRFCIAPENSTAKATQEGTYEIYTAMEEFAVINGIEKILFVASKPVERLMNQIGRSYVRVSEYFSTGDSMAFIGTFNSNEAQICSLIYNGNLNPFYHLNSLII